MELYYGLLLSLFYFILIFFFYFIIIIFSFNFSFFVLNYLFIVIYYLLKNTYIEELTPLTNVLFICIIIYNNNFL